MDVRNLIPDNFTEGSRNRPIVCGQSTHEGLLLDPQFSSPICEAESLSSESDEVALPCVAALSECPFDRPASLQSSSERHYVETDFISPRLEAKGLTSVADVSVRSEIGGLLLVSCPSAIARRVPFRVVDSVDAVPGAWRLFHICKEVPEVSPAIADLDAPVKVGGVARMLGIRYTVDHVGPNPMDPSIVHSMLKKKIPFVAAAGLCVSSEKRMGQKRSYFAARTSTFPEGLPVRSCAAPEFDKPENFQASKSSPSEIFNSWRKIVRILSGHGLCSFLVRLCQGPLAGSIPSAARSL